MWPFVQTSRRFTRLAAKTLSRIANGQVVVVIGSQSFNNTRSYDVCIEIGERLARIRDLVLVTGGVAGVPETVGRSFHDGRLRQGAPENTFQILPKGCGSWDYGETILAGSNMVERREVLGRLGEIYLVIEGGPGTKHEVSVANANGANVIPVGCCGGFAAELWSQSGCPDWIGEDCWYSIGEDRRSVRHVGASIETIVRRYFQDQT